MTASTQPPTKGPTTSTPGFRADNCPPEGNGQEANYDAHLFVAKHLFLDALLTDCSATCEELVESIPLPAGVTPLAFDVVPEYFSARGICKPSEVAYERLSSYTGSPIAAWDLEHGVTACDWLLEHPLTADDLDRAGVPHLAYLTQPMTRDLREIWAEMEQDAPSLDSSCIEAGVNTDEDVLVSHRIRPHSEPVASWTI